MRTITKKPQKRRLILAIGLILGTVALSSHIKSRGHANPSLLATLPSVWQITNKTNDNLTVTTSIATQVIPAGQTGLLQKTPNKTVTIFSPQSGQKLTTTLKNSKIEIAPDNDAGLFFVQPE